MLDDHEITIVEFRHAEIARELFARQLRRRANSIESGMSDVVYAPLFFTGTNESRACFFVGREQQVSETRDGVAHHVINVADDVIAGAVVCGWNSEIRAAKSHRHR